MWPPRACRSIRRSRCCRGSLCRPISSGRFHSARLTTLLARRRRNPDVPENDDRRRAVASRETDRKRRGEGHATASPARLQFIVSDLSKIEGKPMTSATGLFEGQWTYRSYTNNPDPKVDPNTILDRKS